MRLDDGRILPDMFKAIVSNSNIVLFSDGKPTRSFCYVSDAISGLFQMILNEKKWKLYNVGNPNTEINMSDLAKMVAETAREQGWSGKIKYEVSSESDFLVNNPNRRLPSTDLISSELAWEAKVELQAGVVRSVSHFMELAK